MKLIKVKAADVKPPIKQAGFWKTAHEIMGGDAEAEKIVDGVWNKIFTIVKNEGDWDDSMVSRFLDSKYGETLARNIVKDSRVDYNSGMIKSLIKQYDRG
jgi:hypothetical protein